MSGVPVVKKMRNMEVGGPLLSAGREGGWADSQVSGEKRTKALKALGGEDLKDRSSGIVITEVSRRFHSGRVGIEFGGKKRPSHYGHSNPGERHRHWGTNHGP